MEIRATSKIDQNNTFCLPRTEKSEYPDHRRLVTRDDFRARFVDFRTCFVDFRARFVGGSFLLAAVLVIQFSLG